jgi:hypothetical protein
LVLNVATQLYSKTDIVHMATGSRSEAQIRCGTEAFPDHGFQLSSWTAACKAAECLRTPESSREGPFQSVNIFCYINDLISITI